MTELVKREPIIHPITGQVLDLEKAGPQDLAEMIAETDGFKSMLQEVRNLLSAEVLARQDKAAKWTTQAGEYVLKGASPAPTEEFDGAELRTALLELADAGKLDQEAVDAAVETVVTFKARKAGVNALRKLGGEVKDAIDAHAQVVEKRRYVRVERAA